MSVVIDKVLKQHTITPPTDSTAFNARLLALVAKRERLLPVEHRAIKLLTDEIAKVEAEIHNSNAAKTAVDCAMIDPVVFSWTRRQHAWGRAKGWLPRVQLDVPSLAYLPLDKAAISIKVDIWGTRHDEYQPEPPECVLHEWQKIVNGIRSQLSPNKVLSVRLTYSYHGVVPERIRQIINKEEREARFDALGLVCDAYWDISRIDAPPRKLLDPILVGVKDDSLWVIEAFDPTPLESYIANEFTA